MFSRKSNFQSLLVGVGFLTALLSLVSCDPGGRLAQLTPQAPIATPMLLGVTAEPTTGGASESPIPALQPTPTYDPGRAAWTILYYAGGDNHRAGFVWRDLNGMESAGFSEQVHVIAQTDWPADGSYGEGEMTRYIIQPDTDPNQLASPPTNMGEGNMGDPATLVDFLQWGITTFPANHYALIIGDYGGGWQGCCLDLEIGIPDESDHLSLPDLDQAFASALSQTGTRLEVLAFSAGLMSQLDVLQALQPYAKVVVASPELVPGVAWDYQRVLGGLYANPSTEGQQLARDMVNAFNEYQRQPEGDLYSAMAAIDMSAIPRLATAVESLVLSMNDDPALWNAIAADSRRAAQGYGAAAVNDAERIAAVDLNHFAALMAEISPPSATKDAAVETASAATEAIIAFERGNGCCSNGRGIAIYWPASSRSFDLLYPAVTRLPAWASFLSQFVNETPPAPEVVLRNSPRATVNLSQPAIMAAEITGSRIAEVAIVASQETADGRRVLRQLETIFPESVTFPAGTTANLWTDGRHESLLIWDTIGGFIADATGAGDFAVLRAVNPSPIGPQLAAGGYFLGRNDLSGIDSSLIFKGDSGESSQLLAAVSVSSGARLIGQVFPSPGDIFQPAVMLVDDRGDWVREPGINLVLNETATLFRSARPLPDGAYQVGVTANALGGDDSTSTAALNVVAGESAPGFRAYVDAAHDSQFVYPLNWPPPTTRENITLAGSATAGTADQTQLQVRYYPGWTGDLAALQQEVISTIGEVSVLSQDEITVGGSNSVPAIRTAYGYQSPERGERTGVILTFLNDSTGYVVDLDGPKTQESTTLATIDTVATQWQFFSPRLGFGPNTWSTLAIDNYQVDYPTEFAHQPYNNWHRFAVDPQTFVAVRIQPAGRTPAEAMTGLLTIAAEGVAGFVAEEPTRFFRGGQLWERNDFSYVAATGVPMSGVLLSRTDGSQELAIWAETPADQFSTILNRFILPIATSIRQTPVTPEG